MQQKESDLEIIKRPLKFMLEVLWKRHRKKLIRNMGFAALLQIFVAFGGITTGNMLTATVESRLMNLGINFGLGIVASFLLVISDNVMWYFSVGGGYEALGIERPNLLRNLFNADMALFSNTPHGHFVYRVENVEAITNKVSRGVVHFGRYLIAVIISLGYIFWKAWFVGAFIVLGLAFFGFTFYFYERHMATYRKTTSTMEQNYGLNPYDKILSAAEELKLAGKFEEYVESAAVGHKKFTHAGKEQMRHEAGWRAVLRESTTFMIEKVVILLLGIAVIHYNYDLAAMNQITFLLGMLFGGMWSIADFLAETFRDLAKVDKVRQLAEYVAKTQLPEKALELPARPLKIEFKGVQFAYKQEKGLSDSDVEKLDRDAMVAHLKSYLGLNELASTSSYRNTTMYYDVTINPGETVALVGPSGSGKSTFIKLIMGYWYPDEGEVLINGIPTHKLGYKSIARQFSVISQNPGLLDGSILENVLMEIPDLDVDHIAEISQQWEIAIDALKKANFWEEILQWEDLLYTQIGDSGKLLSGGERARLALARSIVKGVSNFVLDEATAALDNELEAKVTESFSEISTGATRIIIAHRLTTVMNADRILVFENGGIVESGTHQELLKSQGLYHRLWHTPFQS